MKMATTEKPKSITITIGDRKKKQFESFVVYDASLEEVMKVVKGALKK